MVFYVLMGLGVLSFQGFKVFCLVFVGFNGLTNDFLGSLLMLSRSTDGVLCVFIVFSRV